MSSIEMSIMNDGFSFETLLKSIYNRIDVAMVRELVRNALDAHQDAGIDTMVDVSLTSKYFYIRDYGNGISPEEMNTMVSVLMKSPKRGDSATTGGYGLGSKTPFGLIMGSPNTGMMTSIHKGRKTIYELMINDDGIPSYNVILEEYSDEASGVSYHIDVSGKLQSLTIKEYIQLFYPMRGKVNFIGYDYTSCLHVVERKGYDVVFVKKPTTTVDSHIDVAFTTNKYQHESSEVPAVVSSDTIEMLDNASAPNALRYDVLVSITDDMPRPQIRWNNIFGLNGSNTGLNSGLELSANNFMVSIDGLAYDVSRYCIHGNNHNNISPGELKDTVNNMIEYEYSHILYENVGLPHKSRTLLVNGISPNNQYSATQSATNSGIVIFKLSEWDGFKAKRSRDEIEPVEEHGTLVNILWDVTKRNTTKTAASSEGFTGLMCAKFYHALYSILNHGITHYPELFKPQHYIAMDVSTTFYFTEMASSILTRIDGDITGLVGETLTKQELSKDFGLCALESYPLKDRASGISHFMDRYYGKGYYNKAREVVAEIERINQIGAGVDMIEGDFLSSSSRFNLEGFVTWDYDNENYAFDFSTDFIQEKFNKLVPQPHGGYNAFRKKSKPHNLVRSSIVRLLNGKLREVNAVSVNENILYVVRDARVFTNKVEEYLKTSDVTAIVFLQDKNGDKILNTPKKVPLRYCGFSTCSVFLTHLIHGDTRIEYASDVFNFKVKTTPKSNGNTIKGVSNMASVPRGVSARTGDGVNPNPTYLYLMNLVETNDTVYLYDTNTKYSHVDEDGFGYIKTLSVTPVEFDVYTCVDFEGLVSNSSWKENTVLEKTVSIDMEPKVAFISANLREMSEPLRKYLLAQENVRFYDTYFYDNLNKVHEKVDIPVDEQILEDFQQALYTFSVYDHFQTDVMAITGGSCHCLRDPNLFVKTICHVFDRNSGNNTFPAYETPLFRSRFELSALYYNDKSRCYAIANRIRERTMEIKQQWDELLEAKPYLLNIILYSQNGMSHYAKFTTVSDDMLREELDQLFLTMY